MNYVFSRAVNRVKKQRKRYAWLAAQIIVGVCILSVALNLSLNFYRQNAAFQKNLARPFAAVTAENVTLSQEEAEELRRAGAILFYQYNRLSGSREDFGVLFADESFLNGIMGMKNPPAGKVLAGKNVQALLESGYQFREKVLPPVAGPIPLSGLDYEAEGLLSDMVYTGDSIQVASFDDYVIFPLDAAAMGTLHLAFPLGDGQLGEKMEALQSELAKSHPEGIYQIRNYAREAEDALSRNAVAAQLLRLLSGFIILIVTLGLVGLLLVLMNSRRRELAVSLMCGASYGQLMAEVFWEIFLVAAFGAVVGNLLCIPFLPVFGGMGVQTGYQPLTLGICVLGAAAVSFGIAVLVFGKIQKITPVMVLKDL